jgi:LPS sulfotransferase NodH
MKDSKFAKPNLLVVGCQKSGTTWLHSALKKSKAIQASTAKELNFFNRDPSTMNWEVYWSNFPVTGDAKYYLESTPHYFQLPSAREDIARRIAENLDNPRVIVVFRNPVERYESAYIHHMMKGRMSFRHEIDDFSDAHKMLSLGRYHSILIHWQSWLPHLKFYFYDDLVASPANFVTNVLDSLGLKNDIPEESLLFRTNDKFRKASRLTGDWAQMPYISDALRSRLHDFYEEDIQRLEEHTGRNLSAWRKS